MSGTPESASESEAAAEDSAEPDAMTRCDADLETDPNNCGACGRTCPKDYPRCEGGDCLPPPAPACGGADLNTDPENCGLCAWACRTGEGCEGGRCVVPCDAELATDPRNCGACGLVCEAGRECRQGECRAIEVGRVTCSADQQVCGATCIPRTECCDDLSCRTDSESTPYCEQGVCVECKLESDCDSDQLCETGRCVAKPVPCGGTCGPAEQCTNDECTCPGNPDLDTDTGNCGTCGNRCGLGQECADGRCQAYCGGARILSDRNNCGQECKRCDVDEQCLLGACTRCGDIQADENNCGACGNRCAADEECVEGDCEKTLPDAIDVYTICESTDDCDAAICIEGTCIPRRTDPRSCPRAEGIRYTWFYEYCFPACTNASECPPHMPVCRVVPAVFVSDPTATAPNACFRL